MAAAKHTPGRWVAVGWVVEHAREDVADIAGCHPWNSMGQAIPRDDAESCANARLIAASPEMLIALRKLLRVTPRTAETVATVDYARRAIARATGKSA
jgi:hypothetical protein